MSRRTNIINNVIYLLLTMGALFAVVYICNERYNEQLFNVMLKFLVGTIIAGLINTAFHELGHLIAGLKNGFAFSAIIMTNNLITIL